MEQSLIPFPNRENEYVLEKFRRLAYCHEPSVPRLRGGLGTDPVECWVLIAEAPKAVAAWS